MHIAKQCFFYVLFLSCSFPFSWKTEFKNRPLYAKSKPVCIVGRPCLRKGKIAQLRKITNVMALNELFWWNVLDRKTLLLRCLCRTLIVNHGVFLSTSYIILSGTSGKFNAKDKNCRVGRTMWVARVSQSNSMQPKGEDLSLLCQ